MKRTALGIAAIALACLIGMPIAARAGVSIDIGIHLPAPPPLVAVPGVPVMYAPGAPANYFFYAGQYYVFTGAAWYASGRYSGPWVAVAPELVPRPLLAVPVRYYHDRPAAWAHARAERAPYWEPHWGRGWHDPERARVAHREHHRDERR